MAAKTARSASIPKPASRSPARSVGSAPTSRWARARRPRSSIPKDIGELDLDWAVKLLDLPRTIGEHPETGSRSLPAWPLWPYLAHNGKYAKLRGTAEVFETGMNAAVAKLAEAANGGGRGARTAAEPLKTFGPHPESGGEMKLMAGRYGPYVTDGTTNATLPRDKQPEDADRGRSSRADQREGGQGPGQEGQQEGSGKKARAEEGGGQRRLRRRRSSHLRRRQPPQ